MLVLDNLQKTFGKQHILQGITHTFAPGSKTVILGSNGSGKSTLIKILSGALEATENPPLFTPFGNAQPVPAAQLGQYVGFAAPYLSLNPLFSLDETLDFHAAFCPFPNNFSKTHWLELAGLMPHRNKRISTFSSGMQQRVRLLLAIANTRPLLLLDEPLSNLDRAGYDFYGQLIATYLGERTVIVGSNYQAEEYAFCDQQILLEKHY